MIRKTVNVSDNWTTSASILQCLVMQWLAYLPLQLVQTWPVTRLERLYNCVPYICLIIERGIVHQPVVWSRAGCILQDLEFAANAGQQHCHSAYYLWQVNTCIMHVKHRSGLWTCSALISWKYDQVICLPHVRHGILEWKRCESFLQAYTVNRINA